VAARTKPAVPHQPRCNPAREREIEGPGVDGGWGGARRGEDLDEQRKPDTGRGRDRRGWGQIVGDPTYSIPCYIPRVKCDRRTANYVKTTPYLVIFISPPK